MIAAWGRFGARGARAVVKPVATHRHATPHVLGRKSVFVLKMQAHTVTPHHSHSRLPTAA